MNDYISILKGVALLVMSFISVLPSGMTQPTFIYNAQTVYNMGDYEVNFTLLQKPDNNYFCMPSYGTAPLGTANFWLAMLETNRDFQPQMAGLYLLDQSIRDSISTMIAYDLIMDNDSAIIACGVVTFRGPQNFDEGFILKLDYDGNPVWFKLYPPVREFRSIIQTLNDDYALCGFLTRPPDSIKYGVVLKTDTEGNALWNRVYYPTDDTAKGDTYFNQIIQYGDTILAIGSTNQKSYPSLQSDVMLVHLSEYGQLLRHVAYERISDTTVTASLEYGKTLKANNFRLWLAGELINDVNNPDNQDIFILEVDLYTSAPVWANKYNIYSDTLKSSAEFAERFIHNADSLQIAGYAINEVFGLAPNENAITLKTDNQGYNPIFHLFGDDNNDKFYKGFVNSDDYITLGGYSSSFSQNGYDDIYLVEKYPTVQYRCHDSLFSTDPIALEFEAYKIYTDSMEIETNLLDLFLNEIRVAWDTICPKEVYDTTGQKVVIQALKEKTWIIDQNSNLTLPDYTREYSVFSVGGAMLYRGTYITERLNVSLLKPGVYFIRIITQNGEVRSMRFIR